MILKLLRQALDVAKDGNDMNVQTLINCIIWAIESDNAQEMIEKSINPFVVKKFLASKAMPEIQKILLNDSFKEELNTQIDNLMNSEEKFKKF